MIPYGKQDLNEADIEAVISVLRSDFLTQGPKVPLFEEYLAEYCGSSYAVASNSATSSLHLACLALELSKEDWLWTSPNSFVASANCGLYCNAKVDFVDIDPLTYNLSTDKLEEKLIQAKKLGKLPKIVIPVHFAGQSCDMIKIKALSDEYGFSIIEDASHAIGAKYKGKRIGSCQYSDITVFSFHLVKIITTAEGGVAITNSKILEQKIRLLNSHGITRDETLMNSHSHGPWYYQQILLGLNYRMTDLQAALGISQLDRIDDFVSKRHAFKERYDQLLKDLPIILPYQSKDSYSSHHLYPIKIDISKENNITRIDVFNKLRRNDIGVNVHYIPVHTQPYYENVGFKKGDYPNAENYYENAISIPIFQGLTIEMQDKVVNILKQVLV